ncbi:hypothetical protein BV898_13496 [Hypsibius exemplaris]|uniref:Uncharacterized protein n=1 Tax=Hypsibius exemplaris TaxID=2072580 RepID=A0A1W0WAK0_HYPEX|nr:hypothetical protein BV898_13496 [Hypsibius exemplaris]
MGQALQKMKQPGEEKKIADEDSSSSSSSSNAAAAAGEVSTDPTAGDTEYVEVPATSSELAGSSGATPVKKSEEPSSQERKSPWNFMQKKRASSKTADSSLAADTKTKAGGDARDEKANGNGASTAENGTNGAGKMEIVEDVSKEVCTFSSSDAAADATVKPNGATANGASNGHPDTGVKRVSNSQEKLNGLVAVPSASCMNGSGKVDVAEDVAAEAVLPDFQSAKDLDDGVADLEDGELEESPRKDESPRMEANGVQLNGSHHIAVVEQNGKHADDAAEDVMKMKMVSLEDVENEMNMDSLAAELNAVGCQFGDADSGKMDVAQHE